MPIQSAHIVPHPPLIIPSIGQGQEKTIKATIVAYHHIAEKIASASPDVILFITPHSISYADYIHMSPGRAAYGNLKRFGSPDNFRLMYDFELLQEISALAEEQGIPAGTLGEKDPALDHGTVVPMHFIDQHLKSYKALRISISGLSLTDHYRFGECIAKAVHNQNRKAVIVASGDLSHKLTEDGPYGFAEEGPAFDLAVTEAMKNADFSQFLNFDEDFCRAAAECGLRSFVIMAGALDGLSLKTEFLSYEGPFGVGYGLCSYEPIGEDPSRKFLTRKKSQPIRQDESEYVKLARETLETYLKTGQKVEPAGFSPSLLEEKAGVFVSLKKQGRLRGCIGTIAPTMPNIAYEIIQNAISAGTRDPRFSPVRPDELDQLVYSVDVLQPSEPVQSASELDVKRYGVIVSCGHRLGLLLPNLAGVDTVEEQLSIALDKGGISPEEAYEVERFEVVRYT